MHLLAAATTSGYLGNKPSTWSYVAIALAALCFVTAAAVAWSAKAFYATAIAVGLLFVLLALVVH